MKNGLILLGVLLWAGLASAGGFDPGLAVRLSGLGPNEELSVLVHLKAQADLALFHPDNKAGMVAELHRVAEATQPALLARYAGRIRDVGRFWIYNGFVGTARKDVILELANDPEVDFVEENGTVRLGDYEKAPGINTIEWNLRKVKADSVWLARGYTGQGVVIGSIDTGVDGTHPALQSRWRSQDGWYDPVSHTPAPHDSNGHGTLGMGIAVGSSGVDTVGVAIGASWIAAKGFSEGGSSQIAWLDSCLQWYAHLDSIGRGAVVVTNGWGLSSRTDTHFWQASRNLQLLGTTVAFGVGGLGPGSGTVPAPSNYPCLFGLGVTDASDNIASFSSRGSAPTGYPWDSSAAWLDPLWGTRTPTNHIKPDLVAPGVNVRSSYINHGYTTISGSTCGPAHLAGAIALIKQKNPNLTPAQLWQIITSTCDTPAIGSPYPNQNYGWGRLNCLRAVDATPSGVEAEQTPGSVTRGRRISIVPNPMREVCLISASWLADEERWSIYDATGRLVKTGTFDHGRAFWDGRDQSGRNLWNGVYFLRTRDRAGAETAKIVLLR